MGRISEFIGEPVAEDAGLCRRRGRDRDHAAGRCDRQPDRRAQPVHGSGQCMSASRCDGRQGVEALIRFASQATAADISAFLKANKATIVGSPADGAFRVRSSGEEGADCRNREKARQDSKVISLALPASQLKAQGVRLDRARIPENLAEASHMRLQHIRSIAS